MMTPTASLKFVNGVLHQLFMVSDKKSGNQTPEWHPVPAERNDEPVALIEEVDLRDTSQEHESGAEVVGDEAEEHF